MQSIIDNLINGNLKEAKRKAKRHSFFLLLDYMRSETEWSAAKSWAAAKYLKGMCSYQDYCDVTANLGGAK